MRIVALIVAVIAVCVFAMFFAVDLSKGKKLPLMAGALVVAAVAGFMSMFTIVDTGHIGLIKTFGKMEDTVLTPGLHFVAPWKSVESVDNRIQIEEDSRHVFSADVQDVTIEYAVNYRLDPTSAKSVYSTIGRKYYDTIVKPKIQGALEDNIGQYKTDELIPNRVKLGSIFEEDLRNRVSEYGIEIVSATITNIDYEDAYTDAVEAKQVATQNLLRAKTEAEQKIVEEQAKADAKIIAAKGDAEALAIEAEGQKKANDLIAQSLTPEILKQQYYEKWDGKLPNVVGSNSTVLIPDMGGEE